MIKMLKVVVAVLILAFGARTLYPAFVGRANDAVALNSTSAATLPSQDVERLMKSAMAGDCQAALKLARHYNEGLDYRFDQALRWYRIAARCPDIEIKYELISWLTTDNQHGEHIAEINQLLAQIEQVNPKRAAAIKQEYQSTKWKSI
jgi:TPR repeat protein